MKCEASGENIQQAFRDNDTPGHEHPLVTCLQIYYESMLERQKFDTWSRLRDWLAAGIGLVRRLRRDFEAGEAERA